MTPTLSGRWQTRLFLLVTVGLVLTLFFADWFESVQVGTYEIPFVVLFWVGLIGLGWDVLYDRVQKGRWDSDWPPAYQLGAGVAEGGLLYVLVRAGWLPGVPAELPFWMFFVHYATVWTALFLMTQGPLRVLYPQWRFRGGQFGRHPVTRE